MTDNFESQPKLFDQSQAEPRVLSRTMLWLLFLLVPVIPYFMVWKFLYSAIAYLILTGTVGFAIGYAMGYRYGLLWEYPDATYSSDKSIIARNIYGAAALMVLLPTNNTGAIVMYFVLLTASNLAFVAAERRRMRLFASTRKP